MLEIIGVIALTLLAMFFISNCLYLPLMAIGFGGWKRNWVGLAVGLALAISTVVGWWFLVGTHIHLEFS